MTAEEPQAAVPFRCTACGTVAAITVHATKYIATIRRGPPHRYKPPAPDCPRCGAGSWVRVGSMTELYAWTRDDDTCQVGGHRDPRTKEYWLTQRNPPTGLPSEGLCYPLGVSMRACPDHVDSLRTNGVLGCFLSPAKE